MKFPSRIVLSACVVAMSCFGTAAQAQTLYGNDGSAQSLWEFPSAPGLPCAQPLPVLTKCGYRVPACPLLPAPMAIPAPPLGIQGDVAMNCLTNPGTGTDTVFITDGRVIEEYVADAPCGAPPSCTPINAFPAPTFMGPLTGMGMDETGALTGGLPVLFITDGVLIAGLNPTPPGSCTPPIVFGPCAVALPGGGIMTDLTWDPTTGTLWVCDTVGLVHNIALGFAPVGCAVIGTFAPASCGLVPPLQGIAFDLGSGRAMSPGALPALYVTDGFIVEYMDVTGAPAAPTFYSPVTCTPTPGPLNGLAYASHSISYGAPKTSATSIVTCGTFGSSCAGSTNFGLEYTETLGVPPEALGILLVNFRPPGPGFLCPPVMGSGGKFWVDPAGGAPAFFFFTPPPGPICVPIATAIPAAVVTGSQVFFQFFFATAPTIKSHTEGCVFTITAP